MFKKILLVLVLLLAAFAAVVAFQPGEFRVERTTTMAAPAADVFAQINDFRKWEDWSPWAKVDPQARTTYEGAESGKGAQFKWAGNSEVGEGSMTIVESRPPEYLKIRLDFLKPMEGTSDVEFHLKEQNGQTDVTWSMSGRNNFIGKAMCLFMNMDKMIGEKYEEGLASIKAIVEKSPQK